MADQLATYLPPEGEKALGDATLEQIRNALGESHLDGLAVCDAADGRAALDRMSARITDGVEMPYPLTVTVLDHEMINAFALPGGHVVFFRGLIDEAEGPDEVAAVFAHELGHVVARDPARIALRTAGSIGVLGLLLGDFAGGAVVLFLTERLIQADYSQQAESEADTFAHRRLREADLPPAALARMFDRLRMRHGESESILSHFLSHPELGDRIARAEAAGEGQGPTRPSLSPAEWQALRTICD
jgi:predicted Zn-dependent protease